MYLDEDEVSEQVSSLKKAAAVTSWNDEPEDGYGYESGLGIVGGSFGWNPVEGKGKNKRKDQAEVARFELRDINVMFPEGKLTLITGPTASGKTSLLVSVLFRPSFSRHNPSHLPS